MPSRAPSRNPTMRGSASHQGAVKRAFPGEGGADPFAPTVQEHRLEQSRAAPTMRRSGDATLMLTTAMKTVLRGLSLPMWFPILELHRVSGFLKESATQRHVPKLCQAKAAKARAAVAALSYSDDRRKFPPVAAVARVPPTIHQDPPRADSVARIATRQGNLPPRREPSRGAIGELEFHPDNPRFVWSRLERKWVAHDGPTEMTSRGTRSRSPPRRPDRDRRDDPYRMTW